MDMTAKIEELKGRISEGLQHAQSPALLYSGGKDSTLLLATLDQVDTAQRVPLICFYDEAINQPERLRFIEEVFMTSDRVLLSFRPKYRAIIPGDKCYELFHAYDLAGACLPVMTDCIDDGSDNLPCGLRWLRGERKDCPDFAFDVLITGCKKTDYQQWFGNPTQSMARKVASSYLFNPLVEWTDEEVWAAIRETGVMYDEERYDKGSYLHLDKARMCCRCLQRTNQTAWCSEIKQQIFV